jgi:hypothetical protein
MRGALCTLRVRIGAGIQQDAHGRGQRVVASRTLSVKRRMAQPQQRLARRLSCSLSQCLRIALDVSLHRRCVAQRCRDVDAGVHDPRFRFERRRCAAPVALRRRTHERLHRLRHAPRRLDVRTQLRPAPEPVLARKHALHLRQLRHRRVAQNRTHALLRIGVSLEKRLPQRLRLTLQMIEIRMRGKLTIRHHNLLSRDRPASASFGLKEGRCVFTAGPSGGLCPFRGPGAP